MIIVDTVLELISSGLLVVTNFYCSGFGILSPLKNFDYCNLCHLEIFLIEK